MSILDELVNQIINETMDEYVQNKNQSNVIEVVADVEPDEVRVIEKEEFDE